MAVGALLAFAGVAAALSTLGITPVPLPTADPTEPNLPGGEPPPTLSDLPTLTGELRASALPAWLGTVAMLLCVLVVVAIVVPLLWFFLRNVISIRRGALPVDSTPAAPLRLRPDDVLAALDAGLAELSDADRDPRRAVIACWVRLEQAAAVAGTPRQPGDTSTDLVFRLLRRHRVDRAVLDRFAETYREARYATHPVVEQTRVAAQSALRQLRGELTAGVGGGLGNDGLGSGG